MSEITLESLDEKINGFEKRLDFYGQIIVDFEKRILELEEKNASTN